MKQKSEDQKMMDILQSFVDFAGASKYVDNIKATKWAIDRIKRLEEIEREHRMINGELANNKVCLHCGKNKAAYCEKCYQELIAENLKLQDR